MVIHNLSANNSQEADEAVSLSNIMFHPLNYKITTNLLFTISGMNQNNNWRGVRSWRVSGGHYVVIDSVVNLVAHKKILSSKPIICLSWAYINMTFFCFEGILYSLWIFTFYYTTTGIKHTAVSKTGDVKYTEGVCTSRYQFSILQHICLFSYLFFKILTF